jgi:hypothetical protein
VPTKLDEPRPVVPEAPQQRRVEVNMKSRAGRRSFVLAYELFDLLLRHELVQQREREHAGTERGRRAVSSRSRTANIKQYPFTLNPRKVLRITLNDGRCDNARDVRRGGSCSCVRRGRGRGRIRCVGDAGLLVVLDGAVPAVDGADDGDVVVACGQALVDEGAGEVS